LLRFLHIAAIYKSSPFFGVLPGDLGGYDRWASTIVEQGWLGAWTALLLVLLGNKIFNRMTGIVAGLLYAFYAPAVYFDGLLLKVTLAAFLFTLAIYLFLHKDLTEVGSSQYFSGFFLGLTCLVRANFLLILPVVLLAVLVNQNAVFRKRLAMTVFFLAGVVSALGPVVARNYYIGNELVLTTAQAGQNFYIGHNPDANGTYIKLPFVHPDPLHEQEDFKKEAEREAAER
jgi:4-amino-4-deoxy-L-arabinose transferase-like glycosyltransferase